MAKVVKVMITGYYLVPDDLSEDVLGMATEEEFIQSEMDYFLKNYIAEDVVELVLDMISDMGTKPTVRLEIKKD